MSNLSAIKGVRTRYRNVLLKELANAKEILEGSLLMLSQEERQTIASKSLKVLKVYARKVEEQMTKVIDAVGSEDSEYVEIVLDEDCELMLSVEQCCVELEQWLELLHKNENMKGESDDHELKKLESAQFIEVQEKMKDMIGMHMQQQREFMELQVKKDKENHCSVKLPRIDLKSFGGNKLLWTSFWDAYECTVHNNRKLSNIEKFNYLISKLFGEARRSIEGLALSNENYQVAIEILKERFGDRQEIITLRYKALMNIPCPSVRVESLRSFLNDLEIHLRSLEVLNEDVNQHVFVSMITSKLPENILRQLELNKGAKKEWTVRRLIDEIREYVSACEKAEKGSRENRDKAFQSQNSVGFKSKQAMHQEKRMEGKFAKPGGSAESLFVKAKETQGKQFELKCRYCLQRHWSDECAKYKTVEERKKCLMSSCYKCLKDGHMTRDCKTKKLCVYCGKFNTHHRSLCPKKFGSVVPSSVCMTEESDDMTAQSNSQAKVSENALISVNEVVLMQTAQSTVANLDNSREKTARIMFDSGSQRTYITENLAKTLALQIEREQELKLVTFGSKSPKIVKTKVARFGITLKDGTQLALTANIVPTISGAVKRNPLKLSPDAEMLIRSVDLADTFPTVQESSTVEVLIGSDYYLDFVLSQKMTVSPGLYLLSSKLGWILTGRLDVADVDSEDIQMFVMTYGKDVLESSVLSNVDDVIPTKPDLEDFWNIETIGIMDKPSTSDDQLALDNFKETLQYENSRYQVVWPWKDEDPDLPVNKELAFGRLKSCLKKMHKRPELLQRYDSIIEDQLKKGIIEKVESTEETNLQHYIPHHAVLVPKFRVVYDASAKTRPENHSLNECLYRGPVMLHDLCGLLLRFRLHPIALVSDIEKAFLQIGLQPSQRDVTRFLWLKDVNSACVDGNNIQEYRFCRVPFGVISSPFLLGATIEAHLELYNTATAHILKDDIYCDNVISGAGSDKEAIEFYQESKSIFTDASMNLRDWLSNSEAVNSFIPVEDRAQENIMSVLGHLWDHKGDTLSLKLPKLQASDEVMTKRNILKAVASIFDPLGLIAPISLKGKVLLQRLWSRGLDWDDSIVDEELRQFWISVESEWQKIPELLVPRCLVTTNQNTVYSLCCFCDASKDAYAATIYLRQENEEQSKVNLVFSKTRLTPVKGMTIPRLELMAVLIGTRCLEFVKSQMKIQINKTYLWTDSRCVLDWLISEKQLPVFVKNRVSEIKKHEDIIMDYVNTKENPADIASRGTTIDNLKSNPLWWHGPMWLMESPATWATTTRSSVSNDILPIQESDAEPVTVAANEGCESSLVANLQPRTPFDIECTKFSSLSKLIRVTAYVLRFVKKLKHESRECQVLKSYELLDAERLWLRYVQLKKFEDVFQGINTQKPTNLQRQLGLFIDNDGILRCKGRLEHAGLRESARIPVLLPKDDHLTKLIVERVHRNNLHSGVSHTLSQVRQRFWIVHGRATVKSILRTCTVCRRHEGGPYKMPPMASFPKARVNEAMPFSHIGIDYMGPMFIRTSDGQQKVWICLFTCLVTRAIHLEIVLDMSTEQYLLCFRRFIAQRGTPVELISDNAKQFKAAATVIDRVWNKLNHSDELQCYFSDRGIKCTFIVELAPWMGGFYERLVGIVKRALRKSVGRKLLSVMQLQTLLKEVESVVNSRPLVYVNNDIDSNVTLTPSHFLSLNPNIGVPEVEFDESDPDFRITRSCCDQLLKLWKKGQKLLDAFWTIWREEYLVGLRERMQSTLKQSRIMSHFSPSVGDVVLLKDDLPRGCWKMGRISELIHSRDGYVRSAKVVTASGRVLGRPLKLLFPIECSEKCDAVVHSALKQPEIHDVRPVRVAAQRASQKLKQHFGD